MTKEKMEEKIICLLGYCSEDVINSINDIFEEFTRTNICIPKGENRHPYADVWHTALEESAIIQCRVEGKSGWFNAIHNQGYEYRIKPSDPIYEWRYQIDTSGVCIWTACWYTDEEAIKEIKAKFPYCEKMEETKQERK